MSDTPQEIADVKQEPAQPNLPEKCSEKVEMVKVEESTVTAAPNPTQEKDESTTVGEALSPHHDSEYDTASDSSEGDDFDDEDGIDGIDEEESTEDDDEDDEDNDSALGDAERERGDGAEQDAEATKKKVDDDEDRSNPQYIPKKGTFYEHDDRTADEPVRDGGDPKVAPSADEEQLVSEKGEKVPATAQSPDNSGERAPKSTVVAKKWQSAGAGDRWSHDRFDASEQAPKSRSELVSSYGYDIRNEDGPPKARRRYRYGRGPNKYTRKWEDESAYSKTQAATRRKPRPEDFPALGAVKASSGSPNASSVSPGRDDSAERRPKNRQPRLPLNRERKSGQLDHNASQRSSRSAALEYKNQNRNRTSESVPIKPQIKHEMTMPIERLESLHLSVAPEERNRFSNGYVPDIEPIVRSNSKPQRPPSNISGRVAIPRQTQPPHQQQQLQQQLLQQPQQVAGVVGTTAGNTISHVQQSQPTIHHMPNQQHHSMGIVKQQQQQVQASQPQPQTQQSQQQTQQQLQYTKTAPTVELESTRPKRYSSFRQQQHQQQQQLQEHQILQQLQQENTYTVDAATLLQGTQPNQQKMPVTGAGYQPSPKTQPGNFFAETSGPNPYPAQFVAAPNVPNSFMAPGAQPPAQPVQQLNYPPQAPPTQQQQPAQPSVPAQVPSQPTTANPQAQFQNYQGYPGFPAVVSLEPPPPNVIHQIQGGITYYAPQPQLRPILPQRRPTNAIPILAPPDRSSSGGKGRGRLQRQGLMYPDVGGDYTDESGVGGTPNTGDIDHILDNMFVQRAPYQPPARKSPSPAPGSMADTPPTTNAERESQPSVEHDGTDDRLAVVDDVKTAPAEMAAG